MEEKPALKDAVWEADDRLLGTRDDVAQQQCGQAPEMVRDCVTRLYCLQ